MSIKAITISMILSFGMCQFSDVEVSLDLRNVSKNDHLLLDDFKKSVKNYFEDTIFSQDDLDLEIPIKIHIVIESINRGGPQKIRAQFFASNSLDLNLFSKSSQFSYSRGETISYSSEFTSLGALLNYFAYIFLANELDMYSELGGSSFLNLAEKISLEGRDSNYSNGWNSLWKKVKKINENIYLRKLRYHLYELKYYIANPTEEYQKIINNLALEIENDIYYLKEFFPNDRNVFLFLSIHAKSLALILRELKMYDTLTMLKNYDVDNKEIYLKEIDSINE
tara:strand:- start:207 stop:1049 length:843 start_codon:yes stop_codon:yes gene_type:complete